MNRANPCHFCGATVDFSKGGAVIAMTFCIGNITNISNYSFCCDCYKERVEQSLKKLNDDANMKMLFGGTE